MYVVVHLPSFVGPVLSKMPLVYDSYVGVTRLEASIENDQILQYDHRTLTRSPKGLVSLTTYQYIDQILNIPYSFLIHFIFIVNTPSPVFYN